MTLAATKQPVARQQCEFERVRALVQALRSPACYPHPVGDVQLIETHISWVLLAGDFAYKVKKPVDLGFVDFRESEARRFFCDEEIRLNRRTAPNLYLDVVAITGRAEAPVVAGDGRALEHAVRMRRFDQEALFDALARRGALEPRHVDALAREVSRFHASLAGGTGAGAAHPAGGIVEEALRNFAQLRDCAVGPETRAELGPLREWTAREGLALSRWFAARDRAGYVRECHGDLHLGNIALIEGEPVAFDGIEFNANLRWIDVANEVAFTVMDLIGHGLAGLASRFLNAYLQETGDYGALEGLRFHLVYRAMVRAKVAALRLAEPDLAAAERALAEASSAAFVRLAKALAKGARPALILMHGLSGSGKTVISQALLEALGAIRLRSDVERKRLHGLPAVARTGAAPGAGLYTRSEGEKTYRHLERLARIGLGAGFPVIVDAVFARRCEREAFAALAAAVAVPFVIVACDAPEALLRSRIANRSREGSDASEAGLGVLDLQLATIEPLGGVELESTLRVDTSRAEALRDASAALAARLAVVPP